MRIGIISEGHADRAVITNILKGLVGIDSSDIEPLRPIDKFDETDKANNDPLIFGGWSSVKAECETRRIIDEFLSIEGQDFVVIHIDTAEAGHYGITSPSKSSGTYCEELRVLVVLQIDKWLNKEMDEVILHAVAIEEIDAWILPIYDKHNSANSATPKEKLSRILGRLELDSTSDYDNYLLLSKPLSKTKDIKKGDFLKYNCSLKAFYDEVKSKVLIPPIGDVLQSDVVQ